jgi:site-specific recombinase XerD
MAASAPVAAGPAAASGAGASRRPRRRIAGRGGPGRQTWIIFDRRAAWSPLRTPASHPLQGDTLRALRKLHREAPNATFVFLSERGTPFSPAGFAKMVERAGKEAGFAFKTHPHMLRHACGYKLANDGKDTPSLQASLGHKNIQHTVQFTALSSGRFKDFWR